jgi:tRNA(fMet)-specific endonuclease VapC
MIFLLDTDTFVLLLRGTALSKPRTSREKAVGKSAAAIRGQCRRQMEQGHRVGLSAITLAELEYGLRRSGRYEQKRPSLLKTLRPFEAYAFDAVDCVHHYGIVRSALENLGQTIGPLDMLIAAHAMALDSTLVTHNTREFERVPGLKLADWS